jgi:beta-lactamase superfamily II metal-dependent hydrolase
MAVWVASQAVAGCFDDSAQRPDGGMDGAIDGNAHTDGAADSSSDGHVDDGGIDGAAFSVAITFFDVGQGDSTLIESTEGEAVVFDTGRRNEDAQKIGSICWQAGWSFSALVVSHYDADHMGSTDRIFCGPDGQPGVAGTDDDGDGIADARDRPGEYGAVGSDDFIFDTVWDRGDAELPVTLAMAEYLAAADGSRYQPMVGDALDLGLDGFRVEVVAVDGELDGGGQWTPEDENGRSVALLVSHKGFHLLLPGDLPAAAEANLATALQSRGISLDVLHVSHHGSATSTPQSLLQELQPEVAVISVGDSQSCGPGFNPYGHPSQDVLDRLADGGVVTVFQTRQGGAIPQPGLCQPEPGETYPRDYSSLELYVADGDIGLESNGETYRIRVGSFFFEYPADE